MTPPDFDDLVGGERENGEADVDAERARLRAVHELLVAAGPPPELPPTLATPPGRRERPTVRLMPRRRLGAALLAAATLLLTTFGGGYLLGARDRGPSFREDFVLSMHGTGATPRAAASLVLGEIDEAGNWPMEMTVHGLPPLPPGEHYELMLTRNGKPVKSCGYFTVSGRTIVFLNAPYKLRQYDGWIVTREGEDEPLLRTEEI